MIFRFLLLLSLVGCASKGLKSTKEAGFMFLKAKVPYANYVDYYGYVSPKTRADGKYKKKIRTISTFGFQESSMN